MLGEIIADLSNWMYTYLLVILLVAAGLFFTIRNRFPQLRLLREAIRVVVERPEKEGSVSSFQALMVSTASRVGHQKGFVYCYADLSHQLPPH